MKAIIVGVDFYRDNKFEYYMSELANLVDACGFEVIGKLTQKLPKIDNKTYVGSGKVAELLDLVEDLEPEVIILNNEIKGSLNKNLEQILKVKIMDRTQLILEIFASRAQTKEAKLQVSIAQLKYQKPRMLGSYDNLSRQGGGSAGTISRGGGESKMETDKRKIENQIALYEAELEKFVVSRNLQREKRIKSEIPVVSVVGYTNAGKSTLMNALVKEEKQVFEKDMLFATLDTSVRKITLKNNQQFLLVDTVGFVSNLPHDLVKAFRSTLEEVAQSDLIIHLSDLSDVDADIHFDVVENTLADLDVLDIPRKLVRNKVDVFQGELNSEDIYISAKNGIGIENLLDYISGEVFKDYQKVNLHLPFDMMNVISQLNEYTYVSEVEYDQSGAHFEAILSPSDYSKYNKYVVK